MFKYESQDPLPTFKIKKEKKKNNPLDIHLWYYPHSYSWTKTHGLWLCTAFINASSFVFRAAFFRHKFWVDLHRRRHSWEHIVNVRGFIIRFWHVLGINIFVILVRGHVIRTFVFWPISLWSIFQKDEFFGCYRHLWKLAEKPFHGLTPSPVNEIG